jgi:hypothetical protein
VENTLTAEQIGVWVRTMLTLAALVFVATTMADDYFEERKRRRAEKDRLQ